MKEISKIDKVLILVTLLVLHLIFTWSLDVSVSALISNGYVTNGFFNNTPMVSYHIALYGKLFTMIIVTYLSIVWVSKDKIRYIGRVQS